MVENTENQNLDVHEQITINKIKIQAVVLFKQGITLTH